MNRQPYWGQYARCKATSLVIDSRYPSAIREAFKTFVKKYKNYSITEQDLTAMPDIMNTDVNAGVGYIRFLGDLGPGLSGHTYYFGSPSPDPEATHDTDRAILYPAFVSEQPAVLDTMIHEWGHGIGLGHEDCSYRWIRYKNKWRNEQSYFYGNLTAGGFMCYGGKKFNPADDFAVNKILNNNISFGTVSGTVQLNGEPIRGANLIFIDIKNKFDGGLRPLPVRHSVIIDILGLGDGRFVTELPCGEFKVMIVPIGKYSQKTHGAWFLADSQIKDISKPFFLDQKNFFAAQILNKKILKISNGDNIQLDLSIRI